MCIYRCSLYMLLYNAGNAAEWFMFWRDQLIHKRASTAFEEVQTLEMWCRKWLANSPWIPNDQVNNQGHGDVERCLLAARAARGSLWTVNKSITDAQQTVIVRIVIWHDQYLLSTILNIQLPVTLSVLAIDHYPFFATNHYQQLSISADGWLFIQMEHHPGSCQPPLFILLSH